MTAPRRYDDYPQLAEMAREMSPEGRALVAAWHAVLCVGLEAFIRSVPAEMLGRRGGAMQSALWAVRSWQTVMRRVAGVLVDTRPADWCCKVGMAAYPGVCPSHAGPVEGDVNVVRGVDGGTQVYVDGYWFWLGRRVRPPS